MSTLYRFYANAIVYARSAAQAQRILAHALRARALSEWHRYCLRRTFAAMWGEPCTH